MIDDLYNREILRLAADIPLHFRLSEPEASVTHVSRLCGSRVIVDLSMADGAVSRFGHDVKACALGQAAAAIMGRHIIGATAMELRSIAIAMRAMLRDKAPPPVLPRWPELKYLEPARDFPARHGSVLLTFEAVEEAINQIDSAGQKHAEGQ